MQAVSPAFVTIASFYDDAASPVVLLYLHFFDIPSGVCSRTSDIIKSLYRPPRLLLRDISFVQYLSGLYDMGVFYE